MLNTSTAANHEAINDFIQPKQILFRAAQIFSKPISDWTSIFPSNHLVDEWNRTEYDDAKSSSSRQKSKFIFAKEGKATKRMATARDQREWRKNTTSNEAKEEKITKKNVKPRSTAETQLPLSAIEPKHSPQMQIRNAFSFPRKGTPLNVLRAWNENTSQMRKCATYNLFNCSPVPSFLSSPAPEKKTNREQPRAEHLHNCQPRSNKWFHPAKTNIPTGSADISQT